MEHCDISKLIDIMICSSIFVNMEKCLQHIRGKKIDSGTGYMELLYLIGFYLLCICLCIQKFVERYPPTIIIVILVSKNGS